MQRKARLSAVYCNVCFIVFWLIIHVTKVLLEHQCKVWASDFVAVGGKNSVVCVSGIIRLVLNLVM